MIDGHDMTTSIENDIRDGISQCSNRYGEDNNKYIGTNYNLVEPSSYLMYFDVNNSYGTFMFLPLPYRGFESVDLYSVNFLDVADDNELG